MTLSQCLTEYKNLFYAMYAYAGAASVQREERREGRREDNGRGMKTTKMDRIDVCALSFTFHPPNVRGTSPTLLMKLYLRVFMLSFRSLKIIRKA